MYNMICIDIIFMFCIASTLIFESVDIAYQEQYVLNTVINTSVSYTYDPTNPTHKREDYFITADPGSWFYSLTPVFNKHTIRSIHNITSYTIFTPTISNISMDVIEFQSNGVITDEVKRIKSLLHQSQVLETRSDVDIMGENVDIIGFSSYGYTEFVLTPQEIAQNRHMMYSYREAYVRKHEKDTDMTRNTKPIRLCIWGSTQMDGQKHIWLQQLEYLNRSKFSFTWVVAGVHNRDNNSVIEKYFASHDHVRTVNSPVEIGLSMGDLKQVPDDGSVSAWDMWDHKSENIFRYCIHRLKESGYNITAISPPWVREFLGHISSHLQEEQCDVVVYGE